jgi:hypothetical protein
MTYIYISRVARKNIAINVMTFKESLPSCMAIYSTSFVSTTRHELGLVGFLVDNFEDNREMFIFSHFVNLTWLYHY